MLFKNAYMLAAAFNSKLWGGSPVLSQKPLFYTCVFVSFGISSKEGASSHLSEPPRVVEGAVMHEQVGVVPRRQGLSAGMQAAGRLVVQQLPGRHFHLVQGVAQIQDLHRPAGVSWRHVTLVHVHDQRSGVGLEAVHVWQQAGPFLVDANPVNVGELELFAADPLFHHPSEALVPVVLEGHRHGEQQHFAFPPVHVQALVVPFLPHCPVSAVVAVVSLNGAPHQGVQPRQVAFAESVGRESAAHAPRPFVLGPQRRFDLLLAALVPRRRGRPHLKGAQRVETRVLHGVHPNHVAVVRALDDFELVAEVRIAPRGVPLAVEQLALGNAAPVAGVQPEEGQRLVVVRDPPNVGALACLLSPIEELVRQLIKIYKEQKT